MCYLLNHLEKNSEELKYDKFCEYFALLIIHIDSMKKYIDEICKCLLNYIEDDTIESSIRIETTKNNINITGEADLRISDWLFDIKCSIENPKNIEQWHRQLEVYNEFVKVSHIAIINILTNHILIYKTLDDFKKFNITDVENDTNQFDDLIEAAE